MVLQSTRADNNNSAGSASTEELARSISSKPEVRTPWRFRTLRGPVQGVLSLMHHITAIEKKYTSNLATGECSLSKFCVCVYACVCVCVRLCLRLCACLCVRGLCVYMSVSGGCPNQDPKQLFRRVREGTVSGARSEGRSGGRPGGRPEGRSGARSGGRSGGRPEGRSVPRSYNCCLAGTILARIALLSRLAACAAPMCSRAVLQSKLQSCATEQARV